MLKKKVTTYFTQVKSRNSRKPSQANCQVHNQKKYNRDGKGVVLVHCTYCAPRFGLLHQLYVVDKLQHIVDGGFFQVSRIGTRDILTYFSLPELDTHQADAATPNVLLSQPVFYHALDATIRNSIRRFPLAKKSALGFFEYICVLTLTAKLLTVSYVPLETLVHSCIRVLSPLTFLHFVLPQCQS